MSEYLYKVKRWKRFTTVQSKVFYKYTMSPTVCAHSAPRPTTRLPLDSGRLWTKRGKNKKLGRKIEKMPCKKAVEKLHGRK